MDFEDGVRGDDGADFDFLEGPDLWGRAREGGVTVVLRALAEDERGRGGGEEVVPGCDAFTGEGGGEATCVL